MKGRDVSVCEVVALRSVEPYPIERLLDWARLVEASGVAGFGWGVAWHEQGRVRRYRSERSLRDDVAGPLALAGIRSPSYIIHLRRPSFLMDVRPENSQPYLEGGWAFCHNGYFRRHREFRERYAGLLEGTSDSEVGFRLFLDEVRARGSATPVAAEDVCRALGTVARTLTGNANILVLGDDGRIFVHAGHHDNPVYRFRMQGSTWLASGLHSPDGYVYKRLFALAEDVVEVGLGQEQEV